ncbi:redoxin domain-containing protein [Pantoea sp. Eser]|nr:redoxin domain-containing protein [Pantoea sp. Eser]
MNKKILFIPLVLFLLLAAALLWQLTRNADGDDPTRLESELICKPVPLFSLEALDEPGKIYDQQVLTDGKPILLNVWATWCPTCRAEHHYLNSLAEQGIRVVGLDLGVYGAPETFLIDGKGIIRYRHAGDLNERVWQQEVKPLWIKYSKEAGA